MESNQLAILGVHWSSVARDTTYLICHVTSQERVTEESCDVIGWSSSLYINTLQSLLTIVVVVLEVKCFKFVTCYHKATCLKRYVTFWKGVPEGKSPSH